MYKFNTYSFICLSLALLASCPIGAAGREPQVDEVALAKFAVDKASSLGIKWLVARKRGESVENYDVRLGLLINDPSSANRPHKAAIVKYRNAFLHEYARYLPATRPAVTAPAAAGGWGMLRALGGVASGARTMATGALDGARTRASGALGGATLAGTRESVSGALSGVTRTFSRWNPFGGGVEAADPAVVSDHSDDDAVAAPAPGTPPAIEDGQ